MIESDELFDFSCFILFNSGIPDNYITPFLAQSTLPRFMHIDIEVVRIILPRFLRSLNPPAQKSSEGGMDQLPWL